MSRTGNGARDEGRACQPAVLLDRDGVLNERPGKLRYVRRPEEFRWLPGALEALRRLREADYRVLVVTNQAGVARGMMTADDLAAVTEKMRAEAEAAGGRIEAVYTCPHGPEEGCDCRKPAPGMLLQAQREHRLDLTRTWFVGDDERDEQAARAAGCPFVYCTRQRPLLEIVRQLLAGELQEVRT